MTAKAGCILALHTSPANLHAGHVSVCTQMSLQTNSMQQHLMSLVVHFGLCSVHFDTLLLPSARLCFDFKPRQIAIMQ